MIRDVEQLLETAVKQGPKKLAVAAAQNTSALLAALDGQKLGLVEPILVGDAAKITEELRQAGHQPQDFRIVPVANLDEAARQTALLTGRGEADLILKGDVSTGSLMKAVLAEEAGLRTGRLLSDVAIFEDPRPGQKKLLLFTDGGVCIAPTLAQKKEIIENAVEVAHALGVACPNVACLSASEKVSPKMQSSVDAAELMALNQRGEITGCTVGGPLAMDGALDKESCAIKGINIPGCGEADIFLVPNIEVGNVFCKGIVYFVPEAFLLHVIKGAKKPIIISSRSDPPKAKLASLALGVLCS